MKRIIIIGSLVSCALLALTGEVQAQSGIEQVLKNIEANNKELQANAQLITSQKLEAKTDNNLPDPTLSYAHLWGAKDKNETIGELVVSQSFDFPSLYAIAIVDETIKKYLSIVIVSVFVKRKKGDVFSFFGFKDGKNGTFQFFIIFKCQCNCDCFIFIHMIFSLSAYRVFYKMVSERKRKSKKQRDCIDIHLKQGRIK